MNMLTFMFWLLSAAIAGATPTVTVETVLLIAPSEVTAVDSLDSLGSRITGQDQFIPGTKVYLEIWFRTIGPYGIVVAVVNVGYEPEVLGTTLEQVSVIDTWSDTWEDVFAATRTVDDATGRITDVGGITFEGTGLFQWAKLAVIEFDVLETTATETMVCALDGGPTRGFGMVSIGAVEDVFYGCTYLVGAGSGCADLNRDGVVDLADFALFQNSLRAP